MKLKCEHGSGVDNVRWVEISIWDMMGLRTLERGLDSRNISLLRRFMGSLNFLDIWKHYTVWILLHDEATNHQVSPACFTYKRSSYYTVPHLASIL